jgi:hypothetical protein
MDWDSLLTLAKRHHLLAHLYNALSRRRSSEIPDAAMARLHAATLAIAANHLQLSHELLRIVTYCDAQGITVIPFKGPALGEMLYGETPLRTCRDLDFLVLENDFERVVEALTTLGYVNGSRMPREDRLAYLQSARGMDFHHPASAINVDLQTGIAPRHMNLELDLAPLFMRAQRMALGDSTVPVLCAEDQLLLLCLHGGKHGWQRLAWLCDVAQHIHKNSALDWQQAVARARSLRAQRMLLLGLALAEKQLHTVLPTFIHNLCAGDPQLPGLMYVVEKSWLIPEDSDQQSPRRWLLLLRMRESRRDQLACILRYTWKLATEDWAAAHSSLWRRLIYPLRIVMRQTGKAAFPLRSATNIPETHSRQ